MSHSRFKSLPEFIRAKLSAPPRHGDGVHVWLFKVARYLHPFLSRDEIADLLAAAVRDCGRVVPRGEITDAVESSAKCAWKPGGRAARYTGSSWQWSASKQPQPTRAGPPWPGPDRDKISEIAAAMKVGVSNLREASPVRIECGAHNSDWFADRLFPNNPLLCCGISKSIFKTRPREWFRNRLSNYALIVPSAMSSTVGRTQEGHMSAHSLDNTGPRQYLVTESDIVDKDQQASVIWHLRGFATLSLVVDSGGKSLHAWWDCRGMDEAVVARFFHYAAILGADHRMWTRSQFARLPEGWRAEKQHRQHVLYFDPEPGRESRP